VSGRTAPGDTARSPDDRPLLDWLRVQLGDPAIRYANAPRPITHGADTQVYELQIVGPLLPCAELVVRVFRDPGAIDRARREAVIQNTLADAGFPAARVLGIGGRDDGLDAPFLAMERLQGAPLLARIGSLGVDGGFRIPSASAIAREARILPSVPRALASAQQRLHRVEAKLLTSALREHGVEETPTTVDGRLATLAEAVDRSEIAELVEVLAWLHRRRPSERPSVICHGDLQPLNALTSTQGELTGVVDWSWTTIAEPALDVGFTKAAFDTAPVQGPRPLRLPLRVAQRRFASSYLDACRRAFAVDPQRVEYYEVLRCALAVASVTRRRAGARYEQDAVWDSDEGLRSLRSFLAAVTGACR
jgi:aminoglycoside phosphotransferase (APT) family kinase protein